jgi:hypothetical protein
VITTKLARIIDASKKLFDKEPFLWKANKSIESCPFGTNNATRLPNVPHGFNEYANTHNVVDLSASNPSPAHFNFLKSRGLTGDQIRIGIHASSVYQAILRSSIRSRSDQPKKIMVPNFETANYLANMFPGCKLEQIDVGIPKGFKPKPPGRKRKYGSEREKVKHHRIRAKEDRVRLLNEHYALNRNGRPNAFGDIAGINESSNRRCNEITNKTLISDIVTGPAIGTMYSDNFSNEPKAYFAYYSDDYFISVLDWLHKDIIDKKEHGMLISPAIFDPNKCKGSKRGLDNIVYIRGIWLDFEDGDLKPDEFPNLFPHVRMVVFNTFRHTQEKPRYRVFIPTNGKMSPEAYMKIWDQIALKLKDASYSVGKPKKGPSLKKSGLDRSKRPPTSLFYLPCQAENAGESFFKDFKVERTALDPADWIENSAFDFETSEFRSIDIHQENRERDQARIEAAIAEWRTTPQGVGNFAFYRLSISLKKAGMADWEIESALNTDQPPRSGPIGMLV